MTPHERGEQGKRERWDGQDDRDQGRATGDVVEVLLYARQYGGKEYRPEDGQAAAYHEHSGWKTTDGCCGMVG